MEIVGNGNGSGVGDGINAIVTEKDLQLDGMIVSKLASDYQLDGTAKLKMISIDKRQTNLNDKQDIIYCLLDVADEYKGVRGTFRLCYDFYDVGGWQLGSISRDFEKEKEYYPVTGITEPELPSFQYWEDERTQAVLVNQETDLENKIDKLTFEVAGDGEFATMNIQCIKYYNWKEKDGVWGWYVDLQRPEERQVSSVTEKISQGNYALGKGHFTQYISIEKLSEKEARIGYNSEFAVGYIMEEPCTVIRNIIVDTIPCIQYEFWVHTKSGSENRLVVLSVYPNNMSVGFRDGKSTRWLQFLKM